MAVLKTRTGARVAAIIDCVLEVLDLIYVIVVISIFYIATKVTKELANNELPAADAIFAVVLLTSGLSCLFYIFMIFLSVRLLMTTNGEEFDLSKARCAALCWLIAQVFVALTELVSLYGRGGNTWIGGLILVAIRAALIYLVYAFFAEIKKVLTQPEPVLVVVVAENASTQQSTVNAQEATA